MSTCYIATIFGLSGDCNVTLCYTAYHTILIDCSFLRVTTRPLKGFICSIFRENRGCKSNVLSDCYRIRTAKGNRGYLFICSRWIDSDITRIAFIAIICCHCDCYISGTYPCYLAITRYTCNIRITTTPSDTLIRSIFGLYGYIKVNIFSNVDSS